MGELAKLPNIGKAVEEQLMAVGIDTPEKLFAAGSREAWLKIQRIDPSACINRLLALEGAVRGLRKADLPEAAKEEMRAFYRAHKL